MPKYGNKWSITEGIPSEELREWGAQRRKGCVPFPALPGSFPVSCVKAAARPHSLKKRHEICSRTKNLNVVKVVKHPSTSCWDLQMEKSRESHEYGHGYFCLGKSPLELTLEELWQCNFPGREGVAFPIKYSTSGHQFTILILKAFLIWKKMTQLLTFQYLVILCWQIRWVYIIFYCAVYVSEQYCSNLGYKPFALSCLMSYIFGGRTVILDQSRAFPISLSTSSGNVKWIQGRQREKSTDPVINTGHYFFFNCQLLHNKWCLLSLVWFILGTYIVSKRNSGVFCRESLCFY